MTANSHCPCNAQMVPHDRLERVCPEPEAEPVCNCTREDGTHHWACEVNRGR